MDPAQGVFIAAAVSPWHALGVDAWVRSLREDGVSTPGVIMILPHPKDGTLIDASHFAYANEDGGTTIVNVEDSSSPSWFRKIRSMLESCVYLSTRVRNAVLQPERTSLPSASIVSPRKADLRLLLALASETAGFFERFRPAFVTIDEGLGTYASRDTWKLVGNLDRGSSARFNPVRGMLRSLGAFAQGCAMVGLPVESRFLFELDEVTQRLEPVPDVVRDYRALLADVARGRPAPRPVNGRPTGMVLTQPWSEYGQLDTIREMEVVTDAIHILLERGLRVVIKPHPREAQAKYERLLESFGGKDVEVMQVSRPVEEVLGALPTGSCVVGYNSTALVSAAVLFDIPAYSFGRQLIGLPTTGEYLDRSQREFSKQFHHVVSDIEVLVAHGKVAS